MSDLKEQIRKRVDEGVRNDQTQARKKKIETKISKAVGRDVVVTVRGERKFTISTDEVDRSLPGEVKKFFGPHAKTSHEHHDDTGTDVFVEV